MLATIYLTIPGNSPPVFFAVTDIMEIDVTESDVVETDIMESGIKEGNVIEIDVVETGIKESDVTEIDDIGNQYCGN